MEIIPRNRQLHESKARAEIKKCMELQSSQPAIDKSAIVNRYGVATFTAGLNRTEAPSRFARTLTRRLPDGVEFEAYVIV
jgi:hypothetical protein